MSRHPKEYRGLSSWRVLGWCAVSAFFWRVWLGLALVLAVVLALTWCYRHARRLAAAVVLLFCRPRVTHEPRLYHFCYAGHAPV